MTNENHQRVLKLLVGLLFILTFYFVNVRQYAFGFLIYIIMGGLSIIFYLFWGRISKITDLEGIGKNWIRNSFIGLGLAFTTIFLGFIVPGIGAIGTPLLSQSIGQILGVTGIFMVVVVSASVFESVYIVDALTDFFNNFLGLNKIISVILMALIGSAFHFFAYQQNLQSAGGSFLSAFVMFALFGAWAEYQNDLSGVITWHGGINWWLEFGKKIFVV